jgi:hypothetical protein
MIVSDRILLRPAKKPSCETSRVTRGGANQIGIGRFGERSREAKAVALSEEAERAFQVLASELLNRGVRAGTIEQLR